MQRAGNILIFLPSFAYYKKKWYIQPVGYIASLQPYAKRLHSMCLAHKIIFNIKGSSQILAPFWNSLLT